MSRIVFQIAGKPVVDFNDEKRAKYKRVRVYLLEQALIVFGLLFLLMIFLNSLFNLIYMSPIIIVFGVISLILFILRVFWGGPQLLEKSTYINLIYITLLLFLVSFLLNPQRNLLVSFNNTAMLPILSVVSVIFLLINLLVSSTVFNKTILKYLSFAFIFFALLKILVDVINIIGQLRLGPSQTLTFDPQNFYWYALFVIGFAFMMRMKLKRIQMIFFGIILWISLFFLALSLRIDSMWVMFLSIAVTLTYLIVRNFKQIYKNIKLFFNISTDRTIVSFIIELVLIVLMVLLLFGASKLFFQQLKTDDLLTFYKNLGLSNVTISNLLFSTNFQKSGFLIPAFLSFFGIASTVAFIVTMFFVPVKAVLNKKSNYDLLLLSLTFIFFSLLILPFNEILIVSLLIFGLMCKTKFVFNS